MSRARIRRAVMDTDLGAPIENLLVAILTEIPALPGAACIGRSALFESAATGEPPDRVKTRHLAAQDICSHCPALDRCRQWARHERAHGAVLAGMLPSVSHAPQQAAS